MIQLFFRGGDDQDWDVTEILSRRDFLGDGVTAENGHAKVQDDEIRRRPAVNPAQGFQPIGGFRHFEPRQ